MLTLITLCSYIFYANKDNIYQLLGIKEETNEENENEKNKNDDNNELTKTGINKKPFLLRSHSETNFVKSKTLLRTYSDVDLLQKL